jgi:hypothetical protein
VPKNVCACARNKAWPLVEAWLREERHGLSCSASVAQPIDYTLKRWDRFARFIEAESALSAYERCVSERAPDACML